MNMGVKMKRKLCIKINKESEQKYTQTQKKTVPEGTVGEQS